jgi:hypothetical protein
VHVARTVCTRLRTVLRVFFGKSADYLRCAYNPCSVLRSSSEYYAVCSRCGSSVLSEAKWSFRIARSLLSATRSFYGVCVDLIGFYSFICVVRVRFLEVRARFRGCTFVFRGGASLLPEVTRLFTEYAQVCVGACPFFRRLRATCTGYAPAWFVGCARPFGHVFARSLVLTFIYNSIWHVLKDPNLNTLNIAIWDKTFVHVTLCVSTCKSMVSGLMIWY